MQIRQEPVHPILVAVEVEHPMAAQEAVVLAVVVL
jgi:hypothetical protein